MGAFEYSALDTGGRESRGVLEGDTARQVRQQLREQGLVPLAVQEVKRRESHTRGFSLRRGASSADLALITRQLATLIRSGLPVEEALRAAAQQTDKAHLKSMLVGVRSRVMEGHPLAAALADFPQVFPDMYRATVMAGEQSGRLDGVLERLADYTETRQAIGQKMMLALLYPAILTVVALLAVILLLAYVVPQVVSVFEDVGQQLPLLTRGLIVVSEFMQASGVWLILAIVGGIAAFRWMLRYEKPRWRFHRLLLRLPLIARLVRGVDTARFARTFGILTASGVPVLEALAIVAQVITNRPMRHAVEDAARRVREGASLYGSLETSGLFPPITLHLIASGEASGKLDEMLMRAAENQERELETLRGALLGVFEPLMILVMGGIVLVIVLAILLPIFDLNQLVR